MMQVHQSFDCARCGRCCASQDLVQLTAYELFGLAGHLGLPPATFFDRYCVLAATSLNPASHLYIRTTDSRCPFLDGSLCAVHEARPFACRAYPMRQLSSTAGSMKAFIREKYPLLEGSCSVFQLPDEDLLAGDPGLLADQSIAYMVDEVYFNTLAPDAVDLSVPYAVTAELLKSPEAREAALEHLSRPGESPLKDGRVPGLAAMMLQARQWGLELVLVRQPSSVSVREDPRMGKYLLATTGCTSVAALQALVEGGMAMCRAFRGQTAPGKALISAVYAPSAGRKAIGFQLEIDDASLEAVSRGCTGMLYVFFLPDDGSSTRAVGLVISGVT